MAALLIVHHSPSATLQQMLEQVADGASAASTQLAETGGRPVEIRQCPALETGPGDVLAADGYLLGTPANLGYMSGALKHFFDVIYEPCRALTAGRPYGLYLHGQSDTEGARLAVEKITTGLQWRLAQRPVASLGPLDDDATTALWELGAAMAAGLGT
ncbi:MAG: hypothetical protein AAFN30_17355 [Actinomycetota bacterium]